MFFRDPGGNGGPSLFTVDISGRNEQRVPTPGLRPIRRGRRYCRKIGRCAARTLGRGRQGLPSLLNYRADFLLGSRR